MGDKDKKSDIEKRRDVQNTEEISDQEFYSALAVVAQQQFSPDGFRSFFRLITGKPLLPHAKEWVETLFKAREDGKTGIVVEAFRGSTKTTTLRLFAAYFIGHHPSSSSLLIQVGDDIAQDNSEAVADIIANSDWWKVIFPGIVPDYEKGWGAGGYEVKRTDIPYGEWRAMNADRKDPTFIGLGYKSRAIIGKRPSGFLLIDDIHDENNTSSQREMARVIKVLTGTIFPTIVPDTWVVFVGTPWVQGDVIDYIKSLPEDYTHVYTPVLKDGVLVWPERFSEQELEKKKRESGPMEYARMYLLDLEAAAGQVLRKEWLHLYPAADIDASWPMVFGVDYASTQDKLKDQKRDYFTIAFIRLIPGGGIVVQGGIRKQIAQGEAEQFVKTLASDYHPKIINIEAIGKGEEFYSLMLRNSTLPVRKITHGRRSKGDRFEKQMAPLFYSGRAWISSEYDEFLRTFVQEWCLWPNAEHDDTLDAVYLGMFGAQASLQPPPDRDRLPSLTRETETPWWVGVGR